MSIGQDQPTGPHEDSNRTWPESPIRAPPSLKLTPTSGFAHQSFTIWSRAGSTPDVLGRLPVNLSGLTNLHRMANTPDPRDFYRVSRAVLVPSLWRESLGRVPMEAMANGIPVLASDRGALPETLGNAGFVFTIPERYTPQSLEIPTPARSRRG